MIPNVADHTPFHAAILYVRAGLRVFPTVGKEPAKGFDWDKDAWSTEAEVREYWGEAPEDAWGLALPMALNGLVAVDLDKPDQLNPEIHDLLNTAGAIQTSDASSGRMHFIWSTDEVIGNSAGKFPSRGAGLDVRGTGYLIVAPTVHARTGEPYRWVMSEPAPLPEKFRHWFSDPGASAQHPASDKQVEQFFASYDDALAAWKLDERVAAFQAEAERSSRNNAAVMHFSEAFREARAGNYPADALWDKLREALDVPDTYEDERAERLLRLGVANAMAASWEDLDRLRPAVFPTIESASVQFWQRPVLATIRQAARARLINPYALLGAVLVDVVAATPPTVQLETFGGAKASLNLFVALCGSSGSGKTMTAEAVRDVIRIQDRTRWENLRSGEGLVSCFVRKEKGKVEQVGDRAVVEIDEIDRLTALSNRSGATIMPTLRSAWVAQGLGGRAATASSDLSVDAHSYRCCLVAGVQPGRSRALFDDADGGTPQRFVWLPANDPEAQLGHEWPDAIEWSVPPAESGTVSAFGGRASQFVPRGNMTLPPAVIEEFQQDRLQRARGQGDELDSHKMLATAKVAAAFALLDMSSHVTDQHWRDAKHLMNVSTITRARLKAELQRNAELEAQSKGRADGIRQAVADETSESVVFERTRIKVEKLRAEGLSRSQIRTKLSKPQREYLDELMGE